MSGIRVYLDANIIIHLLEGIDHLQADFNLFYKLVEQQDLKLITSQLSLTEVLTGSLKRGDNEQYDLNLSFIQENELLTTYTLLEQDFILAAHLRNESNLKTPDALHLACALGQGCSHFLTQDTRIKSSRSITVSTITQFVNSF